MENTILTYMLQKVEKLANNTLKLIGSKFFLYATLLWFGIQSLVMVIFTKIGLPPDENWHIGLIRLYTRDGVDPFIQNQSGYYFLGDVTRNVNILYHYILSFPYRFFDFIDQPDFGLYMLRGISLVLGLLTVYFTYKILLLIKAPRYIANLTVFFLTNTTMFVVISASISYDAPLLTITALSIYLTLLLIKEFSLNRLLLLALVVLVGVSTKTTYAPIAVILLATYLISQYRDLGKLPARIKSGFNQRNKTTYLLFGAVLLLLMLFSTTYLNNYTKYKDFSPRCNKIHSVEQCRQSAIFVRNEGFAKLNPDPATLARFDIFTVKWGISMQERLFGYFSGNSYIPFTKVLILINLFYLIGAVLTIRYIQKKDRYQIILLIIAGLYYLTLLIANWTYYRTTGIFGYALQGRYALPIWFIFNYLGLLYLSVALKNKKIILTSMLLLFCFAFFISSIPTYLIKTDSSWRSSQVK